MHKVLRPAVRVARQFTRKAGKEAKGIIRNAAKNALQAEFERRLSGLGTGTAVAGTPRAGPTQVVISPACAGACAQATASYLAEDAFPTMCECEMNFSAPILSGEGAGTAIYKCHSCAIPPVKSAENYMKLMGTEEVGVAPRMNEVGTGRPKREVRAVNRFTFIAPGVPAKNAPRPPRQTTNWANIIEKAKRNATAAPRPIVLPKGVQRGSLLDAVLGTPLSAVSAQSIERELKDPVAAAAAANANLPVLVRPPSPVATLLNGTKKDGRSRRRTKSAPATQSRTRRASASKKPNVGAAGNL